MNSWTPARRALAIVTVVGGLAVVGSYAYGFVSIPGGINGLWGQTPDGIKGVYGAGMALGAAGFFAYTWHLLFGVDAARARVGDRFGYGLFVVLYALVLVPSALWLPLLQVVRRVSERLQRDCLWRLVCGATTETVLPKNFQMWTRLHAQDSMLY